MKQGREAKALDKEIERIYYANCSGIQINVMDISKVFKAGREASFAGKDMTAAVVACVQALRKN